MSMTRTMQQWPRSWRSSRSLALSPKSWAPLESLFACRATSKVQEHANSASHSVSWICSSLLLSEVVPSAAGKGKV